MRRRTLASLAALVLTAAAVLGAAPAGAAPGDAAATGLTADLDATIAGVAADVSGSVGAVTAPPSSSSELVGADATLGSAALELSASAVSTDATSEPGIGSSAFAEVADVQLDAPVLTPIIGGLLLDGSGTVIRAEADCPVGSAPTASVSDDITLSIAGVDVVVDADGSAEVDLLGVGGAVIGTVTLQLDETTTTSTTAAAVAVQLDLTVDLVGTAVIEGSVTVAQASCETPLAVVPSAATIDPDEGPTSGGTDVTITGTGFVPGATSVTIGGITVPPGEVTVAPGGESLDFTTPPHAAGEVDVTVTTPGGTTGPLAFTYVAPDPAPTADDVDPDQGPTTGGTVVVVTGTGFVPGETTVTIGGVVIPADEVDVADDGTSLSFTTPPHAAGEVELTVTTPDGTTDPLTYTYVAADDGDGGPGDGGPSAGGPGAGAPFAGGPSSGSGAGGPSYGSGDPYGSPAASDGGGSLARTGSDVGTLVLLGLGALVTGALLRGVGRRSRASRTAAG